MSIKQLPLTLIVAATPKNGIGKNGALPWPMLKKEMAYFARVTKRVPMPANTGSVQSDAWKQANLEGTRRNVVIMGRKTWESIPPKFRPLKDRTNIVVSTQDRSKLGGLPEEVLVARDIMSGLEALERRVRDDGALPVGRAFVIGGASIYKAAMDLPQTKSILMTRIHKDYECDTFFSEDLEDSRAGWQLRTRKELQEYVHEVVSEEPLTDGSDADQVSFQFQLYQRP
ncbi:hypothetical protein LTR91_007796 [Friedmanniomyces endolithicus]|nr:hypothetical protein LTS09_010760 [Friedmanniomyces endolithicus]KAK0279463.1 hypothetical protein LTR35_008652 [Friedmanniomyces endolithicus]KAK0287929.1 hypothetical protein LTS00_009774 [Friedmanniomyces endolithicus]KAK0310411.1 hypothetical protein LTR01_003563 [Friedmanniomyces endolithicus]KAK0320842.1 hypothetical protein LTR82_008160 [Friedmanniomyces endolithicus]